VFVLAEEAAAVPPPAAPPAPARAGGSAPSPPPAWSMHVSSVHASAEESVRGEECERSGPVSEQSQETPSTSAGRKLFLGGLNASITEAVLAEYFLQFGTIADVVVMRHGGGATCRTRGFGFITFDDAASAQLALRERYHQIYELSVEVKMAIPHSRELPPLPFEQAAKDPYAQSERVYDVSMHRHQPGGVGEGNVMPYAESGWGYSADAETSMPYTDARQHYSDGANNEPYTDGGYQYGVGAPNVSQPAHAPHPMMWPQYYTAGASTAYPMHVTYHVPVHVMLTPQGAMMHGGMPHGAVPHGAMPHGAMPHAYQGYLPQGAPHIIGSDLRPSARAEGARTPYRPHSGATVPHFSGAQQAAGLQSAQQTVRAAYPVPRDLGGLRHARTDVPAAQQRAMMSRPAAYPAASFAPAAGYSSFIEAPRAALDTTWWPAGQECSVRQRAAQQAVQHAVQQEGTTPMHSSPTFCAAVCAAAYGATACPSAPTAASTAATASSAAAHAAAAASRWSLPVDPSAELSDLPSQLSDLPAELILEIAIRSPLRAFRSVLRFDVRAAGAVRLQRRYRLWVQERHALKQWAHGVLAVGDRVFCRRPILYATIGACIGPATWKLQLLHGGYLDAPLRHIHQLQPWSNGPWYNSVGRSAALASASASRDAAMQAVSAAVAAACCSTSSPSQTALAVAAASAASQAAAAATAASSAVVAATEDSQPARLAGAAEASESACLSEVAQMMNTLNSVTAQGSGVAAGAGAELMFDRSTHSATMLSRAVSAATEAATAAAAAASAAEAVDAVGTLEVTSDTANAAAYAAESVANAAAMLNEATPSAASEAAAAEVAASAVVEMGVAGRALAACMRSGSEPHFSDEPTPTQVIADAQEMAAQAAEVASETAQGIMAAQAAEVASEATQDIAHKHGRRRRGSRKKGA